LYREPEIPVGWGALVEMNGSLQLRRKPAWHDTTPDSRLRFLERLARSGTRALNRDLQITFDEIMAERAKGVSTL
jgi:hypothetical protein